MKSLRKISASSFNRLDEKDDRLFYRKNQISLDLDIVALSTLNHLLEQLNTEDNPIILDLMAGRNSHVPCSMKSSQITGLGIEEQKLQENKALIDYIIQDINQNPALPFPENTFDIVLCTASFEYIVRPQEIMHEVVRILKPGGMFLIIFSDRYHPEKVIKLWQETSDRERLEYIQSMFEKSALFTSPQTFISRGKPRLKDSRNSHLHCPSDPIYAVYADKKGGARTEGRKAQTDHDQYPYSEQEITQRKTKIKDNLCCPYCDSQLLKWKVPDNPFTEWPNDYFYICFNDNCVYFIRGWGALIDQGIPGSYRLQYNHLTDSCHPIPVFNYTFLKDGIIPC